MGKKTRSSAPGGHSPLETDTLPVTRVGQVETQVLGLRGEGGKQRVVSPGRGSTTPAPPGPPPSPLFLPCASLRVLLTGHVWPGPLPQGLRGSLLHLAQVSAGVSILSPLSCLPSTWALPVAAHCLFFGALITIDTLWVLICLLICFHSASSI